MQELSHGRMCKQTWVSGYEHDDECTSEAHLHGAGVEHFAERLGQRNAAFRCGHGDGSLEAIAQPGKHEPALRSHELRQCFEGRLDLQVLVAAEKHDAFVELAERLVNLQAAMRWT